jgi:hypothetical protein
VLSRLLRFRQLEPGGSGLVCGAYPAVKARVGNSWSGLVGLGWEVLLVGRKVELVFDPFDLTNIRVRADGADHGLALPHQISRHAHPKARPETSPETPQATTGIDYLGLIDAEHTATIAARVNYTALAGDEQPDQGRRA